MDTSARVILITGASRGIGAAIAHGFAAEGAQVIIITSRTPPTRTSRAQIEALGGRALVVEADVADAGQVERMVGRRSMRSGGSTRWSATPELPVLTIFSTYPTPSGTGRST